ncbi:MAG: sensor histidine kinase [Gemmatimonadales bacterium]
MTRPIRRRPRLLQVVFIILLGICTAELGYWVIDEVHYTAQVRSQLRLEYEIEAAAAESMLRAGSTPDQVKALYPDLTIRDNSTVEVTPALLARLDDQRFHRLNRFAWEGAFFLVVLLAAIAVIWRALREEADVRRRQEHFLDAVSHEIKSPLASLRLSAETLALRDPPPERRAELIARMLADLDRLERMDTNVLQASRIESGDTAPRGEPIVLGSVVSGIVEEIRHQAAELDVQLSVEVPPLLMVVADEDRVRTVLRNLLHNAVRAAAPTHGRVEVTARQTADGVTLCVRDEGIGFPPEAATRLFEKFYRVEGIDRARMGGTGLGLYLVRQCVELDAGAVRAESAGTGRGARFTVSWPAAGTPA